MAKPSGYFLPWLVNFCILGCVITTVGKLTHPILSLDIASKLRADSDALRTASSDFGKITQQIPSAVLYPTSVNDVVHVVSLSYNSSVPFGIAARGHGHSVRGQTMAPDGVVVEMSSLSSGGGSAGNRQTNAVKIGWSPSLGYYADVAGGELWIDVLRMTLEHGFTPVSWTDYLYLTVGGTLSNAGISGQSFRYGPQISNVHELDVITGKGKFVTCSKHSNSELFYAVLGGLGQFGIITRARIVLDKAPTRVKWVRMVYNDFSKFTRDQEYLISVKNGLDYVEGSLIMRQSPPNNWRSSFFSQTHQSKINSFLTDRGILYCLEVVKYYDDQTAHTVQQEIEGLLEGLQYIPNFMFKRDVSFVDFLNRVRSGELKLQSKGLWDVPHPWLNLFVPKSGIMDFNAGVFVDILLKQNKTAGPILVYPTTRQKWDDRMSAVTPEEEDTFYCVGLLHSGTGDDWKGLHDQNDEILEFCDKSGIKMKQYLPHYKTREEWENHFGSKWSTFKERKTRFDPKRILSPGQRIFNNN